MRKAKVMAQKLILIAVTSLFLSNDTVMSYNGSVGYALATRTLFTRAQEEREASMVEVFVTERLFRNPALLEGPSENVETTIQTGYPGSDVKMMPFIIEFKRLVRYEDIGLSVFPCKVGGREYYVCVRKIDTKASAKPPFDGDRDFEMHIYKESDMKIYLEHEMGKDKFLSQIFIVEEGRGAQGRVALLPGNITVNNVVEFFRAVEAAFKIMPAFPYGTGQQDGQTVSSIVRFADEQRIAKVVGYADKPAEEIDHASNNYINVKDRQDPEELEFAIVHEILAKLGIPNSINDREDIKELVREEYFHWKNRDGEFCPEKIRDKIAIASRREINLTQCLEAGFVDMNKIADRDYSLNASEHPALDESEAIHMKNLELGRSLPIEKGRVLFHIIADGIIPGEQIKTMQELEQETRKEHYREKIVLLQLNNSKDFLTELRDQIEMLTAACEQQGLIAEFDVACANIDIAGQINRMLGINALAFSRNDGNIIQIENILRALRVLYLHDLAKLKSAYESITGSALSEKLSNISDLAIFICNADFKLKAIVVEDYELRKKINDNMKELIKHA